MGLPDAYLALRLPGQYFDEESGLHYNRARYYSPSEGSYISPDPLGTPDGPNPYAYTAFNPLKYIDPDGLLLFAFDGTGNDRSDEAAMTNVEKFRRLYNDGNSRYITGVGTLHRDGTYGDIVPPGRDMAVNSTGVARIDRMKQYFEDEVRNADATSIMQIDIIGFSRGAAQARDFSNLLQKSSTSATENRISYKTSGLVLVSGQNGEYRYYYRQTTENRETAVGPNQGKLLSVSYKCQPINFRFMGLWDSVLSTNSGRGYKLGIPSTFAHVAHAVALNEYRSDNAAGWGWRNSIPGTTNVGGFDLESIGRSGTDLDDKVRIEMGFLGAHADIGGGFRDDSSLSSVALSWMVQQAALAGVNTRQAPAIATGNSVLHDKSNAIVVGNPNNRVTGSPPLGIEDREVNGGLGGGTERTQTFNNTSLTNAGTHQFINYTPRDVRQRGQGGALDPQTLIDRTGTVNMAQYVSWLRSNGYTLGN